MQDVGGDLGIQGCRFQFLVAEQYLDQADVDFLLEQVGGEGMAQGVHRNAFVDAGLVGRCMDSPVELPGTQRLDRVQARK